MRKFKINASFLDATNLKDLEELLLIDNKEARLLKLKEYFLKEDMYLKCKSDNVDPCRIAFTIYNDNL